MTTLEAAISYARQNRDRFLRELNALLRIPSVSTLPEHRTDMRLAADWLADQMRLLGFQEIAILPTGGHPVLYGELLHSDASAPTVLFYGHYDVQPADPIELWESDPFDPQVRGDDLFARGASDMKGQIIAHLKAVESMVRTSGLPISLKYLIEGEEEIGSPNLETFIKENMERLRSDFCLNADGQILASDTPSLTYALRGLVYFEIRVEGPSHDLHSGQFGGPVDNPANILSRLIGGMHDAQGRIALPGFYDDVRPLSEKERAELNKLPQTDLWWMEQTGTRALGGEVGFTATEKATARPSLDVNGLLSGFTGVGSKTVLPAEATAKVSMRLVPDQTPAKIRESLRDYLETNAPPSVEVELEDLVGCVPALIERDTEPVRAASRALESVWGVPPLFKREGGTVPVVGMIKEILGLESLMLGFGLPDDNLHAPNEKLHVPNFYRGIETFVRFMHEISVGGR